MTYNKDEFLNLVDKHENVFLFVFLQNMFGINTTRSKYLCALFGYSLVCRVKELKFSDFMMIKQLVEQIYGTELYIKREVIANINLLKKIKCFRGLRHFEKLPVRGQRTHTNAQTQKKRRG